MKNVIILGCPRAGKTTLAGLLNKKLNMNIISIDSLVSAFRDNFQETNINHHAPINQKSLDLSPFVYSYAKKITHEYPYHNFVIEGWHVLPIDIIPLFDIKNYLIICLGYPDANVETMFNLIRRHDTHYSTTVNLSDEKLKGLVTKSIQWSKELLKQSSAFNIPFFDTSINRNIKLDEIFEYIKQNIEENIQQRDTSSLDKK